METNINESRFITQEFHHETCTSWYGINTVIQAKFNHLPAQQWLNTVLIASKWNWISASRNWQELFTWVGVLVFSRLLESHETWHLRHFFMCHQNSSFEHLSGWNETEKSDFCVIPIKSIPLKGSSNEIFKNSRTEGLQTPEIDNASSVSGRRT